MNENPALIALHTERNRLIAAIAAVDLEREQLSRVNRAIAALGDASMRPIGNYTRPTGGEKASDFLRSVIRERGPAGARAGELQSAVQKKHPTICASYAYNMLVAMTKKGEVTKDPASRRYYAPVQMAAE